MIVEHLIEQKLLTRVDDESDDDVFDHDAIDPPDDEGDE